MGSLKCNGLACIVCLSVTLTDISGCDTWRKLKEVQDPELRRLAESLPETVLHSRADSTTAKYLYAYQRWKKSRKEVKVMPVDEVHFALYLQHLSEMVTCF